MKPLINNDRKLELQSPFKQGRSLLIGLLILSQIFSYPSFALDIKIGINMNIRTRSQEGSFEKIGVLKKGSTIRIPDIYVVRVDGKDTGPIDLDKTLANWSKGAKDEPKPESAELPSADLAVARQSANFKRYLADLKKSSQTTPAGTTTPTTPDSSSDNSDKIPFFPVTIVSKAPDSSNELTTGSTQVYIALDYVDFRGSFECTETPAENKPEAGQQKPSPATSSEPPPTQDGAPATATSFAATEKIVCKEKQASSPSTSRTPRAHSTPAGTVIRDTEVRRPSGSAPPAVKPASKPHNQPVAKPKPAKKEKTPEASSSSNSTSHRETETSACTSDSCRASSRSTGRSIGGTPNPLDSIADVARATTQFSTSHVVEMKGQTLQGRPFAPACRNLIQDNGKLGPWGEQLVKEMMTYSSLRSGVESIFIDDKIAENDVMRKYCPKYKSMLPDERYRFMVFALSGLVQSESSCNEKAKSPTHIKNKKGQWIKLNPNGRAVGLFQMEENPDLRARRGIKCSGNMYKAQDNIRCAVSIFDNLLRTGRHGLFGGNNSYNYWGPLINRKAAIVNNIKRYEKCHK